MHFLGKLDSVEDMSSRTMKQSFLISRLARAGGVLLSYVTVRRESWENWNLSLSPRPRGEESDAMNEVCSFVVV